MAFAIQMLRMRRAVVPFNSGLVPNGTFDNATGWTLGTGWSISGGQLVANQVGFGMGEAVAVATPNLSAGLTYRLTYTITSYTSGDVAMVVGNNSGTTRTAAGTYQQDIVYTAGSAARIAFTSPGFNGFVGTIDNVSVVAL